MLDSTCMLSTCMLLIHAFGGPILPWCRLDGGWLLCLAWFFLHAFNLHASTCLIILACLQLTCFSLISLGTPPCRGVGWMRVAGVDLLDSFCMPSTCKLQLAWFYLHAFNLHASAWCLWGPHPAVVSAGWGVLASTCLILVACLQLACFSLIFGDSIVPWCRLDGGCIDIIFFGTPLAVASVGWGLHKI